MVSRIGAISVMVAVVLHGASASAFEFSMTEDHGDVIRDGRIWLRTMTAPYDPANAEETYKVYTHFYDFDGTAPLTKGAGGRFTHHRGLFIGWNKTETGGLSFDTWHMRDCVQQHVSWTGFGEENGRGWHAQRVDWRDMDGLVFIEEQRRISVHEVDGIRIADFESVLTPIGTAIRLRGDSHHAGMQVRMSNEVAENEDKTRYILPEGAEELPNDEVSGAWWACVSVEVGGKRYSVMHMTPPNHPTGVPVYSIRRYARFGAFFEPDLAADQAHTYRFRVLWTEAELDREQCQALYDTYANLSR